MRRHRGPFRRLLLLSVVSLLAYWGLRPSGDGGTDGGGPLALVEAAVREFDGAPALALTFSQPLDARTSYDKHIQVFEMPPRPGDSVRRQRHDDEYGEDEDAPVKLGNNVSIAAPA